jgi:hypothetical protein
MRANSIWGFIALAFGFLCVVGSVTRARKSMGATAMGRDRRVYRRSDLCLAAPRIAGTYNLERENHELALYKR